MTATRLFHTILPIPECCGRQMTLRGNLGLHTLSYQCSRCFRLLNVAVTFAEDAKMETPDAATRAAMDETT